VLDAVGEASRHSTGQAILLFAAIRVPPKLFLGAEAFLRSRSLSVGSNVGASYGKKNSWRSTGSM